MTRPEPEPKVRRALPDHLCYPRFINRTAFWQYLEAEELLQDGSQASAPLEEADREESRENIESAPLPHAMDVSSDICSTSGSVESNTMSLPPQFPPEEPASNDNATTLQHSLATVAISPPAPVAGPAYDSNGTPLLNDGRKWVLVHDHNGYEPWWRAVPDSDSEESSTDSTTSDYEFVAHPSTPTEPTEDEDWDWRPVGGHNHASETSEAWSSLENPSGLLPPSSASSSASVDEESKVNLMSSNIWPSYLKKNGDTSTPAADAPLSRSNWDKPMPASIDLLLAARQHHGEEPEDASQSFVRLPSVHRDLGHSSSAFQ